MGWFRDIGRRAHLLRIGVLLCAAYAVTGWLGLALHAVGGYAALVWAPTGISLFCLQRWGRRLWPAVYAGAFLANLMHGVPMLISLGIAAGNTLAVVLGTSFLIWAGVERSLERIRDVVVFVVFAALMSTSVAASIGAASLFAGGVVSRSVVAKSWVAWWVGDALGALVVAPLLMVWTERPRVSLSRVNVVEVVCLAGFLVGSAALVFGNIVRLPEGGMFDEPYFLWPGLIWAALRFTQHGAVSASLLLATVGVAGTFFGHGPFVSGSVSRSLLFFQIFLGVTTVTDLLLAAAVTEKQRARERLAAAERQARTIAEAIPQLVWTNLPDGTTDYVNARWAEFTGIGLERPGNFPWRKIVHPDDQAASWERWRRLMQAGESYEGEVRLRRASDGAYRWMLIRTVPLRDARGGIERWLGSCTDVDEQKRRREAEAFLARVSAVLSESLDYQRTLVELASAVVPDVADWCSIHLVEDEGEAVARLYALAHSDVAKVKRAKELTRETMPDPYGRRAAVRVIHSGKPELYPEVDDVLLAATAENAPQLELFRGFHLRSAMILPLTARGRTFGAMALMTAESGRQYSQSDLVVAQMLADRTAYAVDNARLFEKAQRAIGARDEFLSVASHELRTPLTALDLQVHSLQRALRNDQALTPEKLLSKMDMIDRQVDRLTKLIESLLDVSRAMAGRFMLHVEQVDFSEVVDDVVRRFGDELTRAGCRLTLRVDPECVGQWDRMRLDQILTNLLSNAMKYGHGRPIDVTLRSQPDAAVLVVHDHGIGISPDDQSRIFERFERATSQRHFGGLGLGLWIVKQIVTAMGGEVEVKSRLSEGAIFSVVLPKVARAASDAESNERVGALAPTPPAALL